MIAAKDFGGVPPPNGRGEGPGVGRGEGPGVGRGEGAGAIGYLMLDASVMGGLCSLLEALADGLPDAAPPGAASHAAEALPQLLGGHCALYDGVVLPLLAASSEGEPQIHRAATQAGREHREAMGQMIELGDALEELAARGRVAHPERLGLMLRAAFDGLERHLRWEGLVLVEAAGRLLDGAAQSRIAQAIVDTRLDDLLRWRRRGLWRPAD